jgi:hypothetical protein
MAAFFENDCSSYFEGDAMADADDSYSRDSGQLVALAKLRQDLANRLIRHAFLLLWVLVGALFGFALLTLFGGSSTDWAKLSGPIDKILTAVLPLLGAWVGAIIAFYFGRENFDAGAQIVKSTQPDRLASIAAKDAMVAAKDLIVVTTTDEDTKQLKPDILKRFEDKGLGRLIIVTDANRPAEGSASAKAVPVGVIHDSYVNKFVADKLLGGAAADTITLRLLLDDPAIQKLLASSIVYVGPETTLAEVRRKMEEASKSAPVTVSDVIVTSTGDAKGDLLGYITDVTLADKGALK